MTDMIKEEKEQEEEEGEEDEAILDEFSCTIFGPYSVEAGGFVSFLVMCES